MTPARVQLSRRKGWRMPANAVKVDRSTKWGNPFKVGQAGIKNTTEAVSRFREVYESAEFEHVRAEIRRHLRGRNLACWCAPGKPCHADVLLEIANR